MVRGFYKKILLSFLFFSSLVFAQTTRKFELDMGNAKTGDTQLSHVYIPSDKNPELVIQEGHIGVILKVFYTQDGKYIFSCSKNEVKLWMAETGNLIRTFKNIDFPFDEDFLISGLFPSFSPAGDYFVYYSESEGALKICYSKNDERKSISLFDIKNNDSGHSCISSDGKYIAVTSNDAIDFYSAKNLKKEFSIQGTNSYEAISFSQDDSFIVAVSKEGLDVFDMTSRTLANKLLHKNDYIIENSITVSKDNNFIIYSGTDKILVYDRKKDKVINSLDRDTLSYCIKCTSDGKLYSIEHDALAASSGFLNVWNYKTGKKESSKEFYGGIPHSMSLSENEDKYILGFTINGTISEFQTKTDEKIRDIIGSDFKRSDISATSNGTFFEYIPKTGSFFITRNDKAFFVFNDTLQKQQSGNLADIFGDRKHIDGVPTKTYPYQANDKGMFGILTQNDQHSLSFYDFTTKEMKILQDMENIYIFRFVATSKGDKMLLYFFKDPDESVPHDFYLMDVKDFGNSLYKITSSARKYWQKIWVSPNDKFFVIDCTDCTEIFDVETGKRVAVLQDIEDETEIQNPDGTKSITFEAMTKRLTYYNVYSGREILASKISFSKDDKYCVFYERTGPAVYDTQNWKMVYYPSRTYEAWISQNGKYLACRTFDDTMVIYDWKSNRKICEYPIKEDFINLCFCSEDTKYATLSYDGILRKYDVMTGNLLASTITDETGDWLSYTPEGYFTGSPDGINKFVHLVDGMQVFELGQLYDALYRPDLVQAKLEGKDIGESPLKDLLSAGNAPDVYFTSVPKSSKERKTKISFFVQDTGGGVGNIYLKHNGRVMQVSTGCESKVGRKFIYTCDVTLSPGQNKFEAYAFNTMGLIESLHATAEVSWTGKTEAADLYLLALGVNLYQNYPEKNLQYSVADASELVSCIKTAPGGIYKSVNAMTLLDKDVNCTNIRDAFNLFAKLVKPDDVFLLYIAGHGVSDNGEYYFLPSDYKRGTMGNEFDSAVSKMFLTENLSKISAQQSLILLDTCSSGSFIGTTTAMEHLAHTSGQVIITAASSTQEASEGYNGHGLFTAVLIDALSGRADTDRNKIVAVSELDNFVKREVVNIAFNEFGRVQTPWSSYSGRNFSLISTGSSPSPRFAEFTPEDFTSYNEDSWYTVRIDDSDTNLHITSNHNVAEQKTDYLNSHVNSPSVKKRTPTPEVASFLSAADKAYQNGDYKSALKDYKKAAKKKDPHAQSVLGDMYYFGQGVNKNNTTAAGYYKKAAAAGDVSAQANIGFMYESGTGVGKDEVKAFQWYELAASEGNAMAQNNLALMLVSMGKYDRAFELFNLAAEDGEPVAQNNLAVMYETGRGTSKDFGKAFSLYEKSAAQGNLMAQTNIAMMYENGRGTAKNLSKAISLYEKSAAAGDSVAQNNLAVLCESGLGTRRDHARALELCEKSAKAGNAYAKINLEILQAKAKSQVSGYVKTASWQSTGMFDRMAR